MPRRAKFVPKHTRQGWCINVPPKFSQSGQRERYFFPNREKADKAAKKLREDREAFGSQSLAIPPSLAEHALAASKLLEPYGISLIESARLTVAAEEAARRSSEVSAALEAFIERKHDRSSSHLQSLRHMERDFLEDFAGRQLASITGEELEAHLTRRTNGDAHFNLRRGAISSFWRWCAKKPRHWCKGDELEHVERRSPVQGAISTLTAKQAEQLLRTAENKFPEAVLGFAILLFAGLRPAELRRLEPTDITEDGISVPASAAKTKRRRFIQMTPTLSAWLQEYPIGASVVPQGWVRMECAVRRLAGWKVKSSLVTPAEPPETAPPWPQNALRHTAATVALAIGKPIDALVFEHGHVGNLNMLRNHYIGQMTKKEALAISRIGPKGKTLSVMKAI